MSATNRGSERIAQDAYTTPGYVVDALLEYVNFQGATFLEPCRGLGTIYERVPLAHSCKRHCEITEGIDYLKSPCQADIIITNPPYSLAQELLEKSLREAHTVIYLLRVNWLGAVKRRSFWMQNKPSHLFVITPRPSFVGNKNDATEYAWFAWDRGNRLRTDHWLTVLHCPKVLG